MLKIGFIAAAVIAVPEGSAAAPETQAVEPSLKPAVKSDVDKVVCRMQDEIGSRLRAHKVCMTVGQWRDNEREYKEHLQEMQDLAPTRPSG
jgi:hypothetical protein